MDNSLLAVRDINHKYSVVGENKRNQGKEGDGLKTGQKLPPFPFIIFIKERW